MLTSMLFINIRRQVNNLVMGGLWFGEHKPVMGTFLKPFQEALSRLEIQGILSFVYCLLL